MRRSAVLCILMMFAATTAFAGGFQVTAQGARAMGMGMAWTAVADDASAVYYNPAGLAFQPTQVTAGAMWAKNLEGQFTGPSGVTEEQREGDNFLPQGYGSYAMGDLRFAIGAYTPFGLPMRWENPDTFTGRNVAYTSKVQTANVNPTIAFKTGSFAFGLGANWVHSKVQLEQRQARDLSAVGLGVRDIADAKVKSGLMDASGWGWNAGVLWQVTNNFRVGAAYRDSIEVEHEPTLEITQIPTGVPAIDAGIATQLPTTPLDARLPIEFPASLNLGAAWVGERFTVAIDADRTEWSSFGRLRLDVPSNPAFGFTRVTDWEDTWAYRVGVEAALGPITGRAGYYVDETPQPLADVGPVLPDADRQGLTLGIGFPRNQQQGLSIDVAYVLVLFDERSTTRPPANFTGRWETTGSELAFNINWRP